MAFLLDYVRAVGWFLEIHNAAISAISAVFVAAFTFTLWRATDRLWRASQDQGRHSERAAEAAQTSAKAAIDTARAVVAVELPRLGIRGIHLFEAGDDVTPVRRDVREGPPPSVSYLRVVLRNTGRTAATIIRICVDCAIVPQILPTIPEYKTVITEILEVPTDSTFTMNWEFPIRITAIEQANIRDQRIRLWVYGFFVYTDFMGDEWELGFSAIWQPYIGIGEGGAPGFRLAGSDAYRYHRKRQTNQHESTA